MAWDFFIGFIYLFCYIIDPFVVAFHDEPLYNKELNRFQRAMSVFLILNMVQVPFAAQLNKTDILAKANGVEISLSKLKNHSGGKYRLDKREGQN